MNPSIVGYEGQALPHWFLSAVLQELCGSGSKRIWQAGPQFISFSKGPHVCVCVCGGSFIDASIPSQNLGPKSQPCQGTPSSQLFAAARPLLAHGRRSSEAGPLVPQSLFVQCWVGATRSPRHAAWVHFLMHKVHAAEQGGMVSMVTAIAPLGRSEVPKHSIRVSRMKQSELK